MPHLTHRASVLILNLAVLAVAGCSSKDQAKPEAAPPSSASAAIVAAPPASDAAPPPAPEPPKVPKKFAKVLHTGDSMVGGGLAWTLGPMIKADGSQYFREVVESGPIQEFAQNEKLPKWLSQYKPDLVILSLGANHVPHFQGIDLDKELSPYVAKIEKRLEKFDCIWFAPPLWKPEKQAPFNAWLKDHVKHCKWYDGSHLEISRRVDHIHPDEAGGKVLAEDFFKFMKGQDPYKGQAPFYAEGEK
jgi:hypothetical protein